MTYHLHRTGQVIEGKVTLPASKSIANRMLVMGALSGTLDQMNALSQAQDTKVLDQLLRSESSTWDVGDAGTAMRFLTAYLSTIPGEWTLTGSARMKERPVGQLVETLRTLGAQIEYVGAEGYPPLRITGALIEGGKAQVDAGISSQFISALLMIAPYLTNGLHLTLTGKEVSSDYIRMTIELMRRNGINVNRIGSEIRVAPGAYEFNSYAIEPDWSAASYWYAWAAFSESTHLLLKGLQLDSIQGDRVVAQLYEPFGVRSEQLQDGVLITKEAELNSHRPFEYDFTSCPDLVQTLLVTCAGLGKPGKFSGVSTLRIKETDRLAAMDKELKKLGGRLHFIDQNQVEFVPPSIFLQALLLFETYKDHRMAMALAPLVLKLGDLEIDDPEVVKKSYPSYWSELEKLNFVAHQIKP